MQLSNEIPIPKMRGTVTLSIIGEDGEVREIQKHNSILPGAKEILMGCFVKVPEAYIKYISTVDSVTDTIIYSQIVQDYAWEFTSITQLVPFVKFSALFETSSFSGAFDKLKLMTDINFVQDIFFSEVTLPSPIIKQANEQLLVTWQIDFV